MIGTLRVISKILISVASFSFFALLFIRVNLRKNVLIYQHNSFLVNFNHLIYFVINKENIKILKEKIIKMLASIVIIIK